MFRKLAFSLACLITLENGLLAEDKDKGETFARLGLYSHKKKDFTKAKEYFQKAYDLNKGWGYYGLGFLYKEGEGVKKDIKKSDEYIQKAYKIFNKECDLGSSFDCLGLAFMYKKGEGVKADFNKAKDYALKSCTLGDGLGCQVLFAFGFSK